MVTKIVNFMKLRHFIFVSICLLMSTSLFASTPLRVAKIFTDHMIFQQQTAAPMWGWAEPGSKVVVKPSWGGSYATKANVDGEWRVEVETPVYGGPHSVKVVCGKETLELRDVMVGEVWICAGQPNMEMPLKGFIQYNQPTEESVETCLNAVNYGDRIRIFTVPRNPQNDAPSKELPSGEWKRASYEASGDCSAIAYFFAEYVNNATQIPVGVIVSAWGGTEIAPWMPRDCHTEALKGLVDDKEYQRRIGYIKPHKGRPRYAGALFNGMINPIKGFAARGFLWYQGCSNKRDNTFYDKLQAAMVARWRQEWCDSEAKMPFYYVLIAPFLSKGAENGFSRGYFVENQAAAAKIIPNCAYVSTEGTGGGWVIHPAQKKPVSRQLAQLALDRIYGVEGIKSGAPVVETCELVDRKYILNVGDGQELLVPALEDIKGFEIAGEDKVFYPAKARMWGTKIEVTVPDEVASPASLRYAFRDDAISNISTYYGFPLPPFRTDDWPLK